MMDLKKEKLLLKLFMPSFETKYSLWRINSFLFPFFLTHSILKFTGKKYCKLYSKIQASILPTTSGKTKAFTGFYSNSLYILQFGAIYFTTNCDFYSLCTVKIWLIFFQRPTKLRFSSVHFYSLHVYNICNN